ncbi:hypothetical protein ORV05_22335 [Amycolatopsis cynarae]|uniref:Uncharacterized protein n=1 Tax=Amycolatopsis cynarae TaxID=2995223 RepID=A0ABY7AUT5_9PSEU|nr:rhomboid-like protein [Amycolatopsis sp. HUAS 11-8]WAL63731.1 hypothetical protein ORV05_22335 [Amycolatopsis sp. HUAS 11-8]
MSREVITRDGRPRWATRLAVLLPSPASTPFTFWYLVLLQVTTAVQHLAGHRLAAKLLALASTDAHNLVHRPVLSLITSGLWIGDSSWLAYAVIFTFAVAPLERRVGAGWTFAVFASGHILATLATELPVMAALSAGTLPAADARWLDIGVSYGFFATAGALVPIVERRFRRWVATGIFAFILVIYLTDEPGSLLSIVTVAGHLIAALIGMLAWKPWLRRRGLTGTLRLSRRPGAPPTDRVPPTAPLAGSIAP